MKELMFAPELRLVLDVSWAKLLTSPWARVFFGVLAQLSTGLCARLQARREGRLCRSSADPDVPSCDPASAADMLANLDRTKGMRKQFIHAQKLAVGCAPSGRLSEMLRALDIARMFRKLVQFSAFPGEGRASSKPALSNDGTAMALDLGAEAKPRGGWQLHAPPSPTPHARTTVKDL